MCPQRLEILQFLWPRYKQIMLWSEDEKSGHMSSRSLSCGLWPWLTQMQRLWDTVGRLGPHVAFGLEGFVGWLFCPLHRSHRVSRNSSAAPPGSNGILPRRVLVCSRFPSSKPFPSLVARVQQKSGNSQLVEITQSQSQRVCCIGSASQR